MAFTNDQILMRQRKNILFSCDHEHQLFCAVLVSRNNRYVSCVTPAGTSNELDVQHEWEENTHTHTHCYLSVYYIQYCTYALLCDDHLRGMAKAPVSLLDSRYLIPGKSRRRRRKRAERVRGSGRQESIINLYSPSVVVVGSGGGPNYCL